MNCNDVSFGYVVLGPYRSGTSITSAIASRLGVNFGPQNGLISGSKLNPCGYYERSDIDEVNSALISSAGFSLADPGHPLDISNNCDRNLAERLKFEWMHGDTPWGIKDPRMCATLLTWTRLNLINPEKLAIVHVRRSLDDATASAFRHPVVRHYCNGTEVGIRTMLAKYADLAAWHVSQLDVPTFSLQYEDLINDPTDVITEFAQFVGEESKDKINAAIKLVGKEQALRRYLLHRWLVKAPKKLMRILTAA